MCGEHISCTSNAKNDVPHLKAPSMPGVHQNHKLDAYDVVCWNYGILKLLFTAPNGSDFKCFSNFITLTQFGGCRLCLFHRKRIAKDADILLEAMGSEDSLREQEFVVAMEELVLSWNVAELATDSVEVAHRATE